MRVKCIQALIDKIRGKERITNKKIYKKLLELEKNFRIDINTIFKYISHGIELHPSYCCERVIINDYHDILLEDSKFPVWYYEHIYRYMFVQTYINDADSVLDIACGSGYGSKLIQETTNASSVLGADLSHEIINFANRLNTNEKVSFKQANALNDKSFDHESFSKIISFETLEHVCEEDMKIMLTNFFKWLKPDGLLLCSTPFEKVAPLFINGQKINQYHFKHYYDYQIKNIISELGYKNIKIFYQDIKSFHTEPTENTPYMLIIAQK